MASCTVQSKLLHESDLFVQCQFDRGNRFRCHQNDYNLSLHYKGPTEPRGRFPLCIFAGIVIRNMQIPISNTQHNPAPKPFMYNAYLILFAFSS